MRRLNRTPVAGASFREVSSARVCSAWYVVIFQYGSCESKASVCLCRRRRVSSSSAVVSSSSGMAAVSLRTMAWMNSARWPSASRSVSTSKRRESIPLRSSSAVKSAKVERFSPTTSTDLPCPARVAAIFTAVRSGSVPGAAVTVNELPLAAASIMVCAAGSASSSCVSRCGSRSS